MPEYLYEITRDHATEVEPHRFVTTASELGWAVGFAPKMLATELGNGQDFLLTHTTPEKWCYSQLAGCITLTVFND